MQDISNYKKIKENAENLPKGDIKFQVVNGFIIFGFGLIWAIALSFVKGIGLKVSSFPGIIISILILLLARLVIRKRREKLKNKLFAK